MTVSVAIVGSGPAAFYTAQALAESLGDGVAIDIVERFPSPYGLIRFGVAPDHQTTKKVSRAFEKTALLPQVRFFGNVEIGRDLSLDELRELYDAVVLAVGAPFDRPIGIPGEDKTGVYGSAAFVGWYNGHPDFQDLKPDLRTKVVAVIGNGNVAIDVARVLVKTPAEMADADLTEQAAAAIHAAPITDVYMFGRRGPIDAKFTNVELREMGKLDICAPIVDAAQLPATVGDLDDDRERRLKERNLATLKDFAARPPETKPKRVHFAFYASPVEILGGERVEAIKLERTRVVGGRAEGTGEFFTVPCGVVIPAVGYRSVAVDGAPFDTKAAIVPSKDGRVGPGLYAVGWIKRGPTGVIATNRPDGETVAEHVKADVAKGSKPGRIAFQTLLEERDVRWVTFGDWKKIEAAEIARATPPSPRRKFTSVAEMLGALG